MFKTIIIGDACVGKSSFAYKYVQNEFPNSSSPFNEFSNKNISFSGITIRIRIVKTTQHDTCGREWYSSDLPFFYCRNTKIVLIAFDKKVKKSFDNVEKWITEARRMIDETASFILVGNKCDLDAEVSTDEAIEKALEYQMHYMEVSALTGKGVNEVFEVAVRDHFQRKFNLWIEL